MRNSDPCTLVSMNINRRIILPIPCCSELEEKIRDDNLLCIMTTEPFSTIKIQPTVYMQSDGGHGGMEAIAYCPFCGVKIEFERSDK